MSFEIAMISRNTTLIGMRLSNRYAGFAALRPLPLPSAAWLRRKTCGICLAKFRHVAHPGDVGTKLMGLVWTATCGVISCVRAHGSP